MGVFFALLALFSWGLGDFLIQRSARRFGDWVALFYIACFGSIAFFPFVYGDLGAFFQDHSGILWLVSFIILFAALLDFEGLRIGKISVVEPVYAFEIPVTALLATYFLDEFLLPRQVIFIAVLVLGIVLISIRSFRDIKHITIERGIWYAACATVGMGAANFLFGVAARETSPLMINWFTSVFIMCVVFMYLLLAGRLKDIGKGFAGNGRLIIGVGFFDNLAWLMFSYAMLYIPIAIATGISEAYIAFAAMLGILVNHERLSRHQWIGFFLVIVSAIFLAMTTS